MFYVPYAILIAVMVIADQVTKYLVRANIPLGGSVEFLPGIMDFTYVKNTGMAFSMFSDYTWVLTLLSAVVTVVLLVFLIRKELVHPFAVTCLSLVIAGAIGNLIDRALLGYVTDMLRTLFMDFAVFNVADICVTCGGTGLAVYVVLFYEKNEGRKEKEGKEENDHPASDG
jgi:signal peptidase II